MIHRSTFILLYVHGGLLSALVFATAMIASGDWPESATVDNGASLSVLSPVSMRLDAPRDLTTRSPHSQNYLFLPGRADKGPLEDKDFIHLPSEHVTGSLNEKDFIHRPAPHVDEDKFRHKPRYHRDKTKRQADSTAKEHPRFIKVSESDGYEFELWEREDGSRYFKFGNLQMDIHSSKKEGKKQ